MELCDHYNIDRWAFCIYDTDNSGQLELEEMEHVMKVRRNVFHVKALKDVLFVLN